MAMNRSDPLAGALRAGERRLMHGAPGLFRFMKSVKGVVAGNRAPAVTTRRCSTMRH